MSTVIQGSADWICGDGHSVVTVNREFFDFWPQRDNLRDVGVKDDIRSCL